jgi:hypothetical protein
LDFLNLVVGDERQWPPSELGDCLKAIRSAASQLEDDDRYQRLLNYLRAHDQEAG